MSLSDNHSNSCPAIRILPQGAFMMASERLSSPASPPLLALLQGDVRHIHRADIFRQRPDEDVVGELFHHLQRPTRDPPYGEDGDEEVFRDAEQIVDRAGVEIDVHTDAYGGIRLHRLLQLREDLEPARLAFALRQPFRAFTHMPRPWIFGPIHPMAEAHDA